MKDTTKAELPERLSVGVRTGTWDRDELVLFDATDESQPLRAIMLLPTFHEVLFREMARRYNALIEAAQDVKLKHVKQIDRSGCGIACVAMIAGKSYDEVRSAALEIGLIDEFSLVAVGNGAGLNQLDLERLLKHFGIQSSWVVPFRNPLIRSIQSPIGSHWVVVDGCGNVLDPANDHLDQPTQPE